MGLLAWQKDCIQGRAYLLCGWRMSCSNHAWTRKHRASNTLGGPLAALCCRYFAFSDEHKELYYFPDCSEATLRAGVERVIPIQDCIVEEIEEREVGKMRQELQSEKLDDGQLVSKIFRLRHKVRRDL